MVITEAHLRQQVRQPRVGVRVSVPAGARLTPSARDFIKQWQLDVVETLAAGIAQPAAEDPAAAAGTRRGWDTPSTFPVVLAGEVPLCQMCGGQVHRKPDHLTQLNASHFAAKTHPRIRLRGQVDSLHATVLMAGHHARRSDQQDLAGYLDTLAAYVREILSAEYNERPVQPLSLDGVSEAQLHHATHDPQGQLGVAHLTIDASDTELMHWLNIARTATRELEINALQVFDDPHDPNGASLVHALNRLSSAFYYCQLRLAGGRPQ